MVNNYAQAKNKGTGRFFFTPFLYERYIDGDGNIGLVLGSFVYFLAQGDTTGFGKRWLEESPSVILPENTIK